MKVHFTTSRISLEKDTKSVRRILDVINESGHTVAREWFDDAYAQYNEAGIVSDDWATIVKENLATIAQADVIIAEASHDSFAVGYLIASAVHLKKPILLLRRTDADNDAFVTGVEDGWILHKKYDEQNVKETIVKFLEENDIKSKDMRFNFFIDRKIYNYLRWAAFKTGKTKAEILRDLVQNEIDKQDS